MSTFCLFFLLICSSCTDDYIRGHKFELTRMVRGIEMTIPRDQGCKSLSRPTVLGAATSQTKDDNACRMDSITHMKPLCLAFPKQNIHIPWPAKRGDTALAGHSFAFLEFEVVSY